MNVKYKIIELHPEQHSIVVRYYTDIVTEIYLASQMQDGKVLRARTDYAIDIPVPVPTPGQLEAIILGAAPIKFLETLENVINPSVDTTMSSLSSIVGVEKTLL